MGSFKNELIEEEERQREEDRRAEHGVRGLRDKNPPEPDAFDYLYDHDQLHLIDDYPEMSWGQVADMAMREANAKPPEAESFEVFAADQ